MWFRIAAMLGCSISEAMDRVDSNEFTQWIAFYNKEPFGYHVENFRMGVIASTVANVAPRKRGTKALKPSDFYPARTQLKPQLTLRQQRELRKRRARKKNG